MNTGPAISISHKFRVIIQIAEGEDEDALLKKFVECCCYENRATIENVVTKGTHDKWDTIPKESETRQNVFRHVSINQRRQTMNFIVNIKLTNFSISRYKAAKLPLLQDNKIYLFPIRLEEDVLTEIGWLVGTGGDARDAAAIEHIISCHLGSPIQVVSKRIRYRDNRNNTTYAHAILTGQRGAKEVKHKLTFLGWDTIGEFGDNVFFVPYERLTPINRDFHYQAVAFNNMFNTKKKVFHLGNVLKPHDKWVDDQSLLGGKA